MNKRIKTVFRMVDRLDAWLVAWPHRPQPQAPVGASYHKSQITTSILRQCVLAMNRQSIKDCYITRCSNRSVIGSWWRPVNFVV